MFYDDSVNNQAQKAARGLFFCAFFDEEKEAIYGRNKNNNYRRNENEIPRAVTQNSILTIEVDAAVESTQEKEEAKWHQLLNAQRTRKILTGPLSGIEKLESGWTVAVTYFNGYRILIPMSEMMINLKGDGRECRHAEPSGKDCQ